MKRWFIALALVVASSAYAWTTEGYDKEMRATIAELDAHYSQEMKTAYALQDRAPKDIKAAADAVQAKWSAHRQQVVRDMTQVHAELKVYEDRQLNSSIRIRAKLQQTLGEIQQWRNLEMGRIQTMAISADEKTRKRLEVNHAADARSSQIQASAVAQENSLRQLNARADKQMFSVKQEVSSFALQHKK